MKQVICASPSHSQPLKLENLNPKLSELLFHRHLGCRFQAGQVRCVLWGSDAGEGVAPSLHAGNVKTQLSCVNMMGSDSAPALRGSRGSGQTHQEVKQGSRGRRNVTRSAPVSGGGGRERTPRPDVHLGQG